MSDNNEIIMEDVNLDPHEDEKDSIQFACNISKEQNDKLLLIAKNAHRTKSSMVRYMIDYHYALWADKRKK